MVLDRMANGATAGNAGLPPPPDASAGPIYALRDAPSDDEDDEVEHAAAAAELAALRAKRVQMLKVFAAVGMPPLWGVARFGFKVSTRRVRPTAAGVAEAARASRGNRASHPPRHSLSGGSRRSAARRRAAGGRRSLAEHTRDPAKERSARRMSSRRQKGTRRYPSLALALALARLPRSLASPTRRGVASSARRGERAQAAVQRARRRRGRRRGHAQGARDGRAHDGRRAHL